MTTVGLSWDFDFNNDLLIDMRDLSEITYRYGAIYDIHPWGPGIGKRYLPDIDVLDNKVIDSRELALISYNYGHWHDYKRCNREYKIWEPIFYGNDSWFLRQRWKYSPGGDDYGGTVTWGISKWGNNRGFVSTIWSVDALCLNGIETGMMNSNIGINFSEPLVVTPSWDFNDTLSMQHYVTLKYKLTALSTVSSEDFLGLGIEVFGNFNYGARKIEGGLADTYKIWMFPEWTGNQLRILNTNISPLAMTQIIDWIQYGTVGVWNTITINLENAFRIISMLMLDPDYPRSGYTRAIRFGLIAYNASGSLESDYCKYDAPAYV